MPAQPTYLCLSLQTAGLDPAERCILEAGVVVLDSFFKPTTDTLVVLVNAGPGVVEMDERAREIHLENGLLAAHYENGSVFHESVLDAALYRLMASEVSGIPQLICNNPRFTRSFIDMRLPLTSNALRADSFDVSTVRKLVCASKNQYSDWNMKKQLGYGQNRCSTDISAMVAELATYLELLRG